jgi:hypothetical protein
MKQRTGGIPSDCRERLIGIGIGTFCFCFSKEEGEDQNQSEIRERLSRSCRTCSNQKIRLKGRIIRDFFKDMMQGSSFFFQK